MSIRINRKISCDVLVIGGGGAGIRAAVTAADRVEKVILLSETPIAESGSTFYPLSFEWGMLSAVDREDALTFEDEILTAAKGCVNPKLVEILASGSMEARAQFIREGLPLTPMRELHITGCFGREPRGDFLRDMDVFIRSQRSLVKDHPHIQMMIGTAVSLIQTDQVCTGALAVDEKGELIQLNAKAVVMAAGGGEGLYEHRASHGALYGNGYAMAARRGARIVNLEFIQFVPGTVEPIRFVNYFPFLLGEHPRVTNGRDEPCMEKYLPEGVTCEMALDAHAKHGPFTCEDDGKYLEYAMVGEAVAGNGQGIKLWPDPAKMQDERALHWKEFLHKIGYDEGTVMLIYPMAQGFNGGILLQDDLSTDIPGLFACGESSGGLHGPDRMGGLCILATQVFGKKAGEAAAAFAGKQIQPDSSESDVLHQLERDYETDGQECGTPDSVLGQIRHIMQENACLHRNSKGLEEGIRSLEALNLKPLQHMNAPDTAFYFRASGAVDAARLILTAMANRKESRGSHDRADYPAHDDSLLKMQWVSMNHHRIDGGVVS